MRGIATGLVVAVLTFSTALVGVAKAQTGDCKAENIFAVVDKTGQRLREINSDAQPRLRSRLLELGKRRGWAEAEIEAKGYAAIEDDGPGIPAGQTGDVLAGGVRLDRSVPGSGVGESPAVPPIVAKYTCA